MIIRVLELLFYFMSFDHVNKAHKKTDPNF